MESVEKKPNECEEEGPSEQCIKMDDGVKILAQIEGEGKPIVLVHGYALTHDMWRYQRPYLKSRGYKVVAIDLRGFGGSDKPDEPKHYTYDRRAHDLGTVIEGLNSPVTLVGFSLGRGGRDALYDDAS